MAFKAKSTGSKVIKKTCHVCTCVCKFKIIVDHDSTMLQIGSELDTCPTRGIVNCCTDKWDEIFFFKWGTQIL